MTFEDFRRISLERWTTYLDRVAAANVLGKIDSGGGRLLFPSLLLCTRTPTHFIAELVGARSEFDGLSLKSQHSTSVNRYFNQFEHQRSKPSFTMGGGENRFIFLTFSHDAVLKDVRRRFPFVAFPPAHFRGKDGYGDTISCPRHVVSFMLENCVIINNFQSIYRVKHVLNAAVANHSVSATEYEAWLMRIQNERRVSGVHACQLDEGEDAAVAGQLANVYLMRESRETTLGEFLRDHPAVLMRGLGVRQFLYEPHLQWVAPGFDDGVINPDLLLQGLDGHWSIYDLKTACLKRTSVTKGGRRRRRFVDYVEEGIAQLAHYASYFEHEANREYVAQNYGADIVEPGLALVVGTFENVSPVEIAEASRRLKNVRIVDYDSLVHMFLSARLLATTDAPSTTGGESLLLAEGDL